MLICSTAASTDKGIESGHTGGDHGIIDNFITALQKDDPSIILTGPEESLETHMMVFCAEEARRSCTVVDLLEYSKNI